MRGLLLECWLCRVWRLNPYVDSMRCTARTWSTFGSYSYYRGSVCYRVSNLIVLWIDFICEVEALNLGMPHLATFSAMRVSISIAKLT